MPRLLSRVIGYRKLVLGTSAVLVVFSVILAVPPAQHLLPGDR